MNKFLIENDYSLDVMFVSAVFNYTISQVLFPKLSVILRVLKKQEKVI